MPFKENAETRSFGVYVGKLGLWFKKIQLKEDKSKKIVVNITKGVPDGSGKLNYANIGSLWLGKDEVVALRFWLEGQIKNWDELVQATI